MQKIIALFLLLAINSGLVKADEGMWIPILLEKYNIEQMQKLGFKLTAEDIYSVNQASMKDAVVIFGGGCTGELISNEGLIITNHHCGYGAIQSHSSIENDYLTNGFWASSKETELTNKNLSVTFLKRMEDVTQQVLQGINDTITEKKRAEIISVNINNIIAKETKDTHYKAKVKSFFHGNQYFLFINEVFTDIRLVGAPPSAIGKFGGDTDNWMWPRHTGDFSLFRIYANKDNEPADYSPENIPYKPLKHFPVSLKGVKEDDFTMVFGFPGSTEQYVPSDHIKMITETVNPQLIDVRTKKLAIIKKYQEADPAVRIQYAAKYARISNSWKRWIGEIKGLEKLNAIQKKKNFESEFQIWAENYKEKDYSTILNDYKELYQQYGQYELTYNTILEVIYRNGMEAARAATYLDPLKDAYKADTINDENIAKIKSTLKIKYDDFFKDYHQPIDKEITVALLHMYKNNISANYQPEIYTYINKKFKGDIAKYVNHLFAKTIFTKKEELYRFIDGFTEKDIKYLEKDPALQLYESFYSLYKDEILPKYKVLNNHLKQLNRSYMQAQMQYNKESVLYPDANFTLRVSYGQVKSYVPRDGVTYEIQTTLDGIIEKDNPDIYDYRVPEKLKELYHSKDFGKYEYNGTVPVCFIATNHTTGGNSGSPVVNANGELIGINFDRAWEGVMSDLMFNPDQCRNISLDMRYVLFLIDKFAGAGYLINEMTVVE